MKNARRSERLVDTTNAYLISNSYTNERYENLANSWQTWLIVNLNTEVGHFLAVLFSWLIIANPFLFDTPSLALNFVGCFYLLFYIYARQLDYINYGNKIKQERQVDKTIFDTVFTCLVVILMTGLIIFMSQLTVHINRDGYLILEEFFGILLIIAFASQGVALNRDTHVYNNRYIVHDRAKAFRHTTGKNTWFKINTVILFLTFIVSLITGYNSFLFTNTHNAAQIDHPDEKMLYIYNIYLITLFVIAILVYQEVRLIQLENIEIETEINKLVAKVNNKIKLTTIFKVVMAVVTGIIILSMFHFLTQSTNFIIWQNISWENICYVVFSCIELLTCDFLVATFAFFMTIPILANSTYNQFEIRLYQGWSKWD